MNILAVTVIVICALRCITLLYGSAEIWGVNIAYWHGFDVDILTTTLVPLLLFIKPVRERCITWILAPTGQHRFPRWVVALCTLAVIALAAWQYPVSYAFLGDGSILLSEVYRTVADNDHIPSYIKPNALLAGMLLFGIIRNVPTEDMRNEFLIFGMLSIAMLIFIFALLRKDATRMERVIFIGGTVWSVAIIFALRYVELYALQFALASLFCFTLWDYIHGRSNPAVPIICLCLTCISGISALIYVPVLIVAMLRKQKDIVIPARYSTAAIPLLLLAAATVVDMWDVQVAREWFIPLRERALTGNGIFEGVQRYTLLSVLHVKDVLNAAYFLSAPSIVLIICCLIADRNILRNGSHIRDIALMMVAAALSTLFVANVQYGMALDWDLLAVVIPAFAFAALSFVHLAMKESPAAEPSKRQRKNDVRSRTIAAFVILFMTLIPGHIWPWIRVNASTASAERYEQLVEYYQHQVPPWNSYRGWMNLLSWASFNDDDHRTIDYRFRAYATGMLRPETLRSLVEDVTRLPHAEHTQVYDRIMDTLIVAWQTRGTARQRHDLDSSRIQDLAASVILRAYRDRVDSAFVVRHVVGWSELCSQWPASALVHAVIRRSLTAEQRSQLIVSAVSENTLDPFLTLLAANIHVQGGDTTRAIMRYRQTITLAPTHYPDIYLTLAAIHYNRQEHAEARAVLDYGLDKCRTSEQYDKLREARTTLD